ncbi:toxin-antitoxin system YwqK family antitoxin [Spirosoma daeguense]
MINLLIVLLILSCTNPVEKPKHYKTTLVKWTKAGKVRAKGILTNEKKQGLWNEFTNDGGLATQCEYLNDTLNGKCLGYWKSGKLMIDGFYKNGLKEGDWLIYYENGKVMQKGTYKENRQVGSWAYFYESGSLEKKKIYPPK